MIRKNYLIYAFLISLVIMLALAGCRADQVEEVFKITSISPSAKLSNRPITLVVDGEGFSRDSVIVFRQKEISTDYIDTTRLSCNIEPADTSFSFTGSSAYVQVYVLDKSMSLSGETKKTNALEFHIQKKPEFSSAILIYEQMSDGMPYLGGNNPLLLVDQKPIFYVIWTERLEPANENGRQRDTKNSSDQYISMMAISQDSGQTWETPRQIPAGDYAYTRDETLYILGSNHDTITRYHSLDSGQTWQNNNVAVMEPTTYDYTYQFAMDDSDNLILVYGETNQQDFNLTVTTLFSSDLGQNWELRGTNFFQTYHYEYLLNWVAINNTGDICLGYEHFYGRYGATGKFYSNDGGITFTEGGAGFYYPRSAMLTDEEKLYIIHGSLIAPYSWVLAFYKSEDLGNTNLTHHLFEGYSSLNSCMLRDNRRNLLLAMHNQIIRSIDDGDTWSEKVEYNNSAGHDRIYMAMDKDNVIYLIWTDNNGLHISFVTNN